MPVFKYEALDAQGVAIKDEIEALSQKEAVSKIRNLGYFPTKVNARGAAKKPAAKALKEKARSRRQSQGQKHHPVCTTAFHSSGRRTANFTFSEDSAGTAKIRNIQKGHWICG
jgi:hypothetical protein